MSFNIFYDLCGTKVYLKQNATADEAIQFCEAKCESKGTDYYYGGQKVFFE